ncbi:alkaline phosphatase D family protein [Engelhardtia mirabilis]|uniref:PhoD-like phosphatase n=1 Tax=Engelhardtia mirabilis TaxID=2528011 RepID=A0A518BRG6_9BACT|nr:PhoD-like phosphatase [Planctomycetes bacterium Pla133]QDV03897.1 PhoD-like phosphatase [Planctomycetes bacterium Pla86]
MLCAALVFAVAQLPAPASGEGELPLALAEDWTRAADRYWLGEGLWGNRLQDWRIRDEALECVGPAGLRWRTAIAAGAWSRADEPRRLEVTVGAGSDELEPGAWAGFLVGAGGAGPEDGVHPLHGLLVQGTVGRGFGWFAGVSASGQLAIERLDSPQAVARLDARAVDGRPTPLPADGLRLGLDLEPDGEGGHRLTLEARDPESGEVLQRVAAVAAPADGDLPDVGLRGQVGLVADPGPSGKGPGAAFRFDDLRIVGREGAVEPRQELSPIVSALYTISGDRLRLTLQMMPLPETHAGGPTSAVLSILEDGSLALVSIEEVLPESWTASFDIDDWDSSKSQTLVATVFVPFRMREGVRTIAGSTADPYTTYIDVPRQPAPDAPLEIALLNCCHQVSHDLVGGWGASGGVDRGDWRTGSWFPHADLVANLAAHEPDLYAFVGDQVYEGASPTGVDRQNLELDYLYKWLIWCLAFRDLTRTRPTIVLPDDHDVYQGNLWGEGGIVATQQQAGGYQHPAEFVAVVEATQTSHLPDTAHPGGVIAQGLPARYGELVWGCASIAILEDRKFKSGCLDERMPETDTDRPDHWASPPEDRALLDPPGLQLLGEAQEAFLARWAEADRGARMKVAVSQSPFAGMATHHGAALERLGADLDSNGWPRSGRDRAVALLRRAGAVHLAGDQHLATLVQHGIEAPGDAVFDFTGPSIANFYPRAWWPSLAASGRPAELPQPADYTGEFTDGLGNLVTVHAAANPMEDAALRELAGGELSPMALFRGMPGYGLVRLDPGAREVTFECWPRFAGPGGRQYPGWPVTVRVAENGSQERAPD